MFALAKTPRVNAALAASGLAAAMLFSAAPALACACCGTFRVVNVANWDVLNVRSGPGVGYQIINALAPDEGCIVQTGERRGAWVRIQARGFTGWVNANYLAYVR